MHAAVGCVWCDVTRGVTSHEDPQWPPGGQHESYKRVGSSIHKKAGLWVGRGGGRGWGVGGLACRKSFLWWLELPVV